MIPDRRNMMNGIIYGIGIGIGDPEDMTYKAVRIIKDSDVLILPRKDINKCRAYLIAKEIMPEIENIPTLALEFEMTGDRKESAKNHAKIYESVKQLVLSGKKVAFLTIGDPALYSTYSYIAELANRDDIETVSISGISSITACANSLGITLCEGDEQLHVIPGTKDMEASLDLSGTKVFMKSGKDMPYIKEVLRRKEKSVLVYAVADYGTDKETRYHGIEELPDEGNYMMTIIVKEKKQ